MGGAGGGGKRIGDELRLGGALSFDRFYLRFSIMFGLLIIYI